MPIARDKQSSVSRLNIGWAIATGGILVCGLALLLFPLARVGANLSFDYSEGWNAYWQGHAAAGIPLYASAPQGTITNYTPLSFHLVGLLSLLVGDVNLTGRLVAAVSFLVMLIDVALIVSYFTRSAVAAVYGATLCLLWIENLTPGRILTNDPLFLALALSSTALYAYLRAQGAIRGVVWSGVLFAVALFVKPNIIAFPTAVVLHLALTRAWRPMASYVVAGAATALILLGATYSLDGRYVLAHLLAPRALNGSDGVLNFIEFCTRVGSSLLIALAWFLSERTSDRRWPLALCLCCALFFALVFSTGNGVAQNIYYEPALILAAIAPIALVAAGDALSAVPRAGAVFACLALLPAWFALASAPRQLYGNLARWEKLPLQEQEYAKGIEFVRQRAGPALCESILMCFEAGKAFTYDPYFVLDQMRIHRVSEDEILAQLAKHLYSTIEIGEDDPSFSLAADARLRFSARFMQTLLQNYHVALSTSRFSVLVPN